MDTDHTPSLISITLRFWDPTIAMMFEAFCLNYPPAAQKKERVDDQWVYTNFFNTKTDKGKFISAWGNLSMERK